MMEKNCDFSFLFYLSISIEFTCTYSESVCIITDKAVNGIQWLRIVRNCSYKTEYIKVNIVNSSYTTSNGENDIGFYLEYVIRKLFVLFSYEEKYIKEIFVIEVDLQFK